MQEWNQYTIQVNLENNEKGLIKDSELLPSGEVYYNESKEAVTYEKDRKKELETRAGIFLALIGILIGLMISNLNFNLWEKGETVLENVFIIILQVMNASPFIFVLLSFLNFIAVLKTYKYLTIQVDKIKPDSLSNPVDNSYKTLFESYRTIYIHNYKLNENKAKNFQKGIYWLKFSVFYYLAIFAVFNILKEVL